MLMQGLNGLLVFLMVATLDLGFHGVIENNTCGVHLHWLVVCNWPALPMVGALPPASTWHHGRQHATLS